MALDFLAEVGHLNLSALADLPGRWIDAVHGRFSRPARSIPRGQKTEIAWTVTFGGRNLSGGKPNGECQL